MPRKWEMPGCFRFCLWRGRSEVRQTAVARRRGSPTAGSRQEGAQAHPCGNAEMVSPEHCRLSPHQGSADRKERTAGSGTLRNPTAPFSFHPHLRGTSEPRSNTHTTTPAPTLTRLTHTHTHTHTCALSYMTLGRSYHRSELQFLHLENGGLNLCHGVVLRIQGSD